VGRASHSMAISFVSLRFTQDDREELAFEVESCELAVVDFCGGVVGVGGCGFIGDVAEGFCDAVGGGSCDSASFAGAPVNGFVL